MKSCPTCKSTHPNEFVVCPQDGASLVELGEWTEGTVIRGKYRILSKLGKGGMGTVYKVMHVAFNEVHALKVINPNLMGDDLFVLRFKHEAVVTRKLRHPNAVRVDDIDEADDGRPIIVMEYIEGQSLKRLIKDLGPLPGPRVCAIIKQVAAALDAAHRLGMIHRDIKPDNIVLVSTEKGEQAKVLDFGIAKLKEQSGDVSGGTLTAAGTVVGTPAYMSPEQAEGKHGDELDGRSDIYSLGVVMYQMLSGELPFKADTSMAMLLARLQKPPAPILSLHPGLQIPAAIAKVVMKTLEKNPDKRPQNAELLIQEIGAAEEQIELMTPALGVTRVADPSLMKPRPVEPASAYSPAEAARALRDSLKTSARRAAQPEPQPPARLPTAPPRSTLPPPAIPSPPAPRPRIPQSGIPQTDYVPPQVFAPPSARSDRAVWSEAEPVPRKSRTGLWIAVSVFAIGVVAVALYLVQRTMSPPETPAPTGGQTATGSANPSESQKPSQPTEAQPSLGSPSSAAPGGQQEAQQQRPQPAQIQQEATMPPATRAKKPASRAELRRLARPQIPASRTRKENHPPQPIVDPGKIAAAKTLGTLFLNRGEYDSAIAEFEKGLQLDPRNAELRSLIERAKKAKDAESRFAK